MRRIICEHIEGNQADYELYHLVYITSPRFCAEEEEGSFQSHIQRMKQKSTYGGNIELVSVDL